MTLPNGGILMTDVGYSDPTRSALAAGVLVENWTARSPLADYQVRVEDVAPYEPGSFYKRELPCLRALLDVVSRDVGAIVVDGYVDLAPGRAGLGRHLYDVLRREIPVIGVAKTPFRGADAHEVFRGESRSPLYVTAAGMSAASAASAVRQMHGPYRIPMLLNRVDRLSRGADLG